MNNKTVSFETRLEELAKMGERELRDAPNMWPKTLEELNQLIQSQLTRAHDYGSVCAALSLVTNATFNYFASEQGMTGFQAQCADLDALRRSRHIKGPFTVLKLEDGLYPQYDLMGSAQEFITSAESARWLREQAQASLKELDENMRRAPDMLHVAPAVVEHWKKLATDPEKSSTD